jgi:hypothetical protein
MAEALAEAYESCPGWMANFGWFIQ